MFIRPKQRTVHGVTSPGSRVIVPNFPKISAEAKQALTNVPNATGAQKAAIEVFVDTLVGLSHPTAANQWAAMRRVWVCAADYSSGITGDSRFSLTGTNQDEVALIGSSVTVSAQGWRIGNGSTATTHQVSANFSSDTDTQDSHAFGVYLKSSAYASGTEWLMGSNGTAVNRLAFAGTSNFNCRNQMDTLNQVNSTDAEALYQGTLVFSNRTASDQTDYYRDGTDLNVSNEAANSADPAVGAAGYYIGSGSTTGNQVLDCTIGFAFVGDEIAAANIAGFNTAVKTLITAMEAS